ncbi:hypothetical protein AGR4A_Cc190189 [Agrobacterium tumefaciens str. B6]|uniref:Uncharacterized protein n=1 Tax=Agrobacterium tumefaciens str. B6 TaxID=1183423 RepID=A0A822UZN5_AGRTU|nr:hypothetical protein AGR4A_Cc190189 [Agrobacterium tumefaciens str. B6]
MSKTERRLAAGLVVVLISVPDLS